jgi:hypothetical protein
LHGLIDRFTTSAGERRQTHVRHSCLHWRRVLVGPCKPGGTTSSRRSGHAGSLTMTGQCPPNGWVGHAPSCWHVA